MAATGSDAREPRRPGAPRARRRTLRLRLTVLYGVCFLVGAAAVLAVTYGLVAHETSSSTRELHLPGSRIALPSSSLTLQTSASGAAGGVVAKIHVSPNGRETITYSTSGASSAGSATPGPSTAAVRSDYLQYSACMRSHGVPDFPDVTTGATATGTVKGNRLIVDGHVLSEPWEPTVLRTSRTCERYENAATPVYTAAQLAHLRAAGLTYSRCMRAAGFAWFPDLIIGRGPQGHDYEVGYPQSSHRAILAAARNPAYKAAERRCGPDLESAVRRPSPAQLASSAQRQIDVIVGRANGALAAQRARSLRALLIWSGVALGVAALISILLGWLLAGRALRPLRRMSSRARRITEESLDERLAVDTQEDELGELAMTFDGVLARLERAFETQRRFVANASHELRTPVTVERTLLEVALSDPNADAETLRRACERVLVSTKRQQTTLEALLALARSQGGATSGSPTDLAEIAQDAITLREQRLEGVRLTTDLQPAPLRGDPALLERLVSNLTENAIVHNHADDPWIAIETGTDAGGSWVRVSNSGPEVPPEMISELFEPFRRMGDERTATATGLGLGLSIVKAVAEVHDADIDARPRPDGGLRVEVRFADGQ